MLTILRAYIHTCSMHLQIVDESFAYVPQSPVPALVCRYPCCEHNEGVKEVSVPHHVACVNGITGTPQSPDGRVSSVLCDTHRGRYCCFCDVRELKKDSHRGLQSNWGKQCQVTIIVEPVDMRLRICFKCWNKHKGNTQGALEVSIAAARNDTVLTYFLWQSPGSSSPKQARTTEVSTLRLQPTDAAALHHICLASQVSSPNQPQTATLRNQSPVHGSTQKLLVHVQSQFNDALRQASWYKTALEATKEALQKANQKIQTLEVHMKQLSSKFREDNKWGDNTKSSSREKFVNHITNQIEQLVGKDGVLAPEGAVLTDAEKADALKVTFAYPLQIVLSDHPFIGSF